VSASRIWNFGFGCQTANASPPVLFVRRRVRRLAICSPQNRGERSAGKRGGLRDPLAAGAAAHETLARRLLFPCDREENASRRSTAAIFVRGPVLPGGGRRP
jgi:hypothetical protein